MSGDPEDIGRPDAPGAGQADAGRCASSACARTATTSSTPSSSPSTSPTTSSSRRAAAGITVDGPFAAGRADGRLQPGRPGAGADRTGRRGPPRQAHPQRRRARRRVGGRRRRPALGRRRRPGPCRRARGRRRVLRARRPGPRRRHRRGARPAAAGGADRHAGGAAVRRVDTGRVPGLGRPGRADRGRRPTTSSPPPSRSSPGWRRGGTASASSPASPRSSPGAGRRGSCRASATTPSTPCGARAQRSWSPAPSH